MELMPHNWSQTLNAPVYKKNRNRLVITIEKSVGLICTERQVCQMIYAMMCFTGSWRIIATLMAIYGCTDIFVTVNWINLLFHNRVSTGVYLLNSVLFKTGAQAPNWTTLIWNN